MGTSASPLLILLWLYPDVNRGLAFVDFAFYGKCQTIVQVRAKNVLSSNFMMPGQQEVYFCGLLLNVS